MPISKSQKENVLRYRIWNLPRVLYSISDQYLKSDIFQVANDPETLRNTANSKIISNVAYHGDLEKKAAMEKQRTFADNGDVIGV